MDAGRELDALVAEKVLGWRRIEWEGGTTPMGRAPENLLSLVLDEVPYYSTDLNAAINLEAWLFARGIRVCLGRDATGEHKQWAVQMYLPRRELPGHYAWAYGATPAEALCRAAFAALAAAQDTDQEAS